MFDLGAAYGRAEAELTNFIENTGFPFLPTPMGKGVVSDDHPLCVSAARSRYLLQWFSYSGKIYCFYIRN